MTRIAIAAVFGLLTAPAATAAAPDADWFILAGSGGCWTSNKYHPATRVLLERAFKGRPLVCLAFTPHDEWLALVGGTEFYFSRDLPAVKKLQELWKNPEIEHYRCAAFSPLGGWVVLADDGTFHADQIPADALARLSELQSRKSPIRSIAFTPQGGWVILGAEGEAWYRDIPDALAQRLDALKESKTQILCTAFDHRGNWIALAERNGLWSNNTDLPVFKQLLELKNQKVPLKWVAFAPGEYPGDYAVVRERTDRVKAVLELDISHFGGRVDEWTIYGPVAPTHEGQERMKTSLTPDGKSVEELSPMKRSVLVSRLRGSHAPLRGTITIEGDLFARRLYPRPAGRPPEPDLDPADYRLYTRHTEHINFDAKPFQEWLDRHDLRRGPDERDLTFARRVYAFIRDSFAYIYPAGDEHAATVCQRQKSDCGGLSIVMVAALRANGIPARVLQGRWAHSDDSQTRTSLLIPGQYHVKAEFFAKGTGWVPVDLAAAVCDRDNGDFAHFGNDPGDFITLFFDSDYEVDTHVSGRYHGLSMQGMLWFWKGEGMPKFGLQEKWTVKK